MSKVILPRKPNAPGGSESQPASSAASTNGSEHSERILLLEDEEETNLVLKEYLQSFGYRVVAVSNGVDGLREVMKTNFELVICDMMMPKLPGDMFYLAVQKTRPKLCDRFVFISGHQGTPQVEAFITRTNAAILTKPFRLQQLELALRGVLSRALKKEEAAAPLRIVPNQHFPKENYSQPSRFETQRASSEKVPSMVAKALKLVGFMRKDEKAAPYSPGLASGGPQRDVPRATRRIAQPQSGHVTRRIPHLANAPLPSRNTPAMDPPRRITRRIPPTPVAPPAAEEPRPAAPQPRPVAPEGLTQLSQPPPAPPETALTLRSVPSLAKEKPPEPAPSASLTRITRKIPAPQASVPAPKVTRTLPKTAPTTPKTTRTIPKVTREIPKTTRTIAKATEETPKTTRTIPKVTRTVAKAPRTVLKVAPQVPKETTSLPKVTIRVQRTADKILTAKDPASTVRPKVTLKLAPKTAETKPAKVTRSIPQPTVSRRIKTEKE